MLGPLLAHQLDRRRDDHVVAGQIVVRVADIDIDAQASAAPGRRAWSAASRSRARCAAARPGSRGSRSRAAGPPAPAHRRSASPCISSEPTSSPPRSSGLVVAEQTGVHQLLGDRGRAPAEIGDAARAVGIGLRRPERDRALGRSGVRGRPVDLAVALLHHPEGALPLQPAVEIVVERDDVRVAGPRPADLLLVAEWPALDLPGRIRVP